MIQSRTHLPGQRRCTSACSVTANVLQRYCIYAAVTLHMCCSATAKLNAVALQKSMHLLCSGNALSHRLIRAFDNPRFFAVPISRQPQQREIDDTNYTSLGGTPNCRLKLREKLASEEAPTL